MEPRRRRDIDDFDNLFDRDEAERRRAERAALIEAGRQRAADVEAIDAAAKERARQFTLSSNARNVLREYTAAGVAPLIVDGDGVPTCTLSLLLRLGWTVEGRSDGPVLVQPPRPQNKEHS